MLGRLGMWAAELYYIASARESGAPILKSMPVPEEDIKRLLDGEGVER